MPFLGHIKANVECWTVQQEEDSFQERALGSLSADLHRAKHQLSAVTEQHTACLEEYLESQTLVSWVKENLKGEKKSQHSCSNTSVSTVCSFAFPALCPLGQI